MPHPDYRVATFTGSDLPTFVRFVNAQVRRLSELLRGPVCVELGSVGTNRTIHPARADLITLTLTGNVTLTLDTAARPGARCVLELAQDATGSRTVSLTNGTTTGWTMTATATKRDMLDLVFNGTSWVSETKRQNY